MEITTYQPQYQQALVQLWLNCQLVVAQNHPVEDIQRKLQHSPEGLFIGLEQNKLIASVMVGFDGHRAWLNYLAVDKAFRLLGYGRSLVEHAEAYLRGRACPKINLQIRKQNAAVQDFYKALGYGEDPVVSMGKRLIEDVDYFTERSKSEFVK